MSARNANFQQWQALLTSRAKRQRAGEFVVQGVRPIRLAIEKGWPVRYLLYPDGEPLSQWARETLDAVAGTRVAMSPELLRELGGKDDEAPELVAVVAMPPDSWDRVPMRPDQLVVVFDRPTTPGNIGTLVRSADAFGADAVVVTGHAADPYDPKSVRAATGSLFAVPVLRTSSHREVVDWVSTQRGRGHDVRIVGTDETGSVDVFDHDLTGPTVVVVGNETRGLSAAWREACDAMVRIPIGGAASSLNAAAAATVVLYEATRQRARP